MRPVRLIVSFRPSSKPYDERSSQIGSLGLSLLIPSAFFNSRTPLSLGLEVRELERGINQGDDDIEEVQRRPPKARAEYWTKAAECMSLRLTFVEANQIGRDPVSSQSGQWNLASYHAAKKDFDKDAILCIFSLRVDDDGVEAGSALYATTSQSMIIENQNIFAMKRQGRCKASSLFTVQVSMMHGANKMQARTGALPFINIKFCVRDGFLSERAKRGGHFMTRYPDIFAHSTCPANKSDSQGVSLGEDLGDLCRWEWRNQIRSRPSHGFPFTSISGGLRLNSLGLDMSSDAEPTQGCYQRSDGHHVVVPMSLDYAQVLSIRQFSSPYLTGLWYPALHRDWRRSSTFTSFKSTQPATDSAATILHPVLPVAASAASPTFLVSWTADKASGPCRETARNRQAATESFSPSSFGLLAMHVLSGIDDTLQVTSGYQPSI
ncbi:hypothetical protein NMY22_g9213 [Coprinellus aureogranulatus]|nr:hypothetical protein NMY22_g9213 [Coprinellus aureogranulatus]